MNKSESKYFNTAEKMDRALLTLLEKKDLPYITVKEICTEAGVNRSTFYLHYETVGDLMAECAEYINSHFLEHMDISSGGFIEKISSCSAEELYLITPEYLTPYLTYIKEYRRLFRTYIENAETLRLEESYNGLLRHVIMPILERYGVPEKDRKYIMAFHIHGLMAIIGEWLKGGCSEPIEYITEVIQKCVKNYSVGK